MRYRTATELLRDTPPAAQARLARDLFDSPLVAGWLQRLSFRTGLNQVHSGYADSFENVMGKLRQLGCRAGMRPLDERTAPYRDWLARELERPARDVMGGFVRIDVGTFLAVAGYGRDPAVAEYLSRRLDTLYRLACLGDYDLYVAADKYRGIPAGFRGRPILRPELFANAEWHLPLIHDVHALAHHPGLVEDRSTRHKIEAVIDYILHPEYQALPQGYGIIPADPGHYYACGWSAHLPGYPAFKAGALRPDGLVQRVALLGLFTVARQHAWWQAAQVHLAGYQTERGHYQFPRAYLPEHPMGYWIAGARMGLEENRRAAMAIEIESTFWMTSIGLTT